jgi:hypothetical protein
MPNRRSRPASRLGFALLLWKLAPKKLKRIAAGGLAMTLLLIAAGVTVLVMVILGTT